MLSCTRVTTIPITTPIIDNGKDVIITKGNINDSSCTARTTYISTIESPKARDISPPMSCWFLAAHAVASTYPSAGLVFLNEALINFAASLNPFELSRLNPTVTVLEPLYFVIVEAPSTFESVAMSPILTYVPLEVFTSRFSIFSSEFLYCSSNCNVTSSLSVPSETSIGAIPNIVILSIVVKFVTFIP